MHQCVSFDEKYADKSGFILQCPIFAKGGVLHGFSLAQRGGRRGHDLRTGAPPESWERVQADLGMPDWGFARVSQVHGDNVLEASSPGLLGEADGVWSREPGLFVSVRTADCTPVLIAGPGIVAAVHAGWRGVAAGILPKTIGILAEYVPRTTLTVCIGPAICGACYEVGEEVVEAIRASGVPESAFVKRAAAGLDPTSSGNVRPRVDLQAALHAQAFPLVGERISFVSACTRSNRELHSHRRDAADSGRNLALIGILP